MYNPATSPGVSDHEFVELYNPSATEAVDLSGWRLDGVALTIPAGTVILPQSYLVVVRNDALFRAQYGGAKFVAAQYTGSLDDEGETLVLRDRGGIVSPRSRTRSSAPWPAARPAAARRSS